MANGKVWIHGQVVPLFQRLQAKLGGHTPFLNVYADERPQGPASLHQPTLYPELNIPADKDGDWGEVARGIAHLVSALDGVPELRIATVAETDLAVAQALNSELQAIAAAKEGLQPKPLWSPGAPDELLNTILNPAPGTLDAQKLFGLVKLYRLLLDEHPAAQAALDEARQQLPNETIAAEAAFDAITAEDLRTPAGKTVAATRLIQSLGFDPSRFYFQKSQHIEGVYDERSLAYYPSIQVVRNEFESLCHFPGCCLKFQLPFALPVLEGIYKSEGVITLVQHVRVVNSRAGWKAAQGMRLDSMMNPSGLYAQSLVELSLPGELAIDLTRPPGDVQYKNIEVYPEAVRMAVLKMNQLIMGLRALTGRSDIPEVLPGDLNQLSFKQFDSEGNIVRNVPLVNFEYVRVSAGAPNLNDEVRIEPVDVPCAGFARELLESAKFHVSAYNTRRAVLELAGAYEAFIEEAITPRIGNVKESMKDQFLRRYGKKLSAEVYAEIENIPLDSNDSARMPSSNQQLKKYKQKELRPLLNKKHLSPIWKVMNVRNDAAHGRAVSPEVLKDVIAGIGALEYLIQAQSEYENQKCTF